MSGPRRIYRKVLAAGVLFAMFCIQSIGMAHADEARIFVIREADGTIRFTNRLPSDDQIAEVFTARSSSVSYYPANQGPFKRQPSLRRFHRNRFDEYIERAAEENSVDPALIKAVIHAESAFNPRAISPKGALGLMQLMPSTARMLGVNNAFAPESNISGGTRYLAQLIRRHGRLDHALAAYNAGDVPVQRYNGIPPYSETINYVKRVLQLKKQYSAATNG